jgi:hypothetical protein
MTADMALLFFRPGSVVELCTAAELTILRATVGALMVSVIVARSPPLTRRGAHAAAPERHHDSCRD